MNIKILVSALAFVGLFQLTSSAQTFPGSDDFSAGDTAKWDNDIIRFSTATTEGNFSFTNSLLEFTKPATTSVYTNQFVRWNSGNGSVPDPLSYSTSWVLTANVTNLIASTPLTSIGIQVSNANNDGYASLVLGYSSTSNLVVRATGIGLTATDSVILGDNTDITLSLAWNASNQTLSSSYAIDGTTFTSVSTYPVSGWTTAPTDGFVMGLWAQTSANLAINTSQLYASNFSVSAVPEPSTYAAIFGGLMLGFAVWRRRKSV